MSIARLALKNLRRNPGRTALKAVGLGAATASMLVWGSLTNGFTSALREAATSLELGQAQLHHPRYLKSQSPYDRIQRGDELRSSLVAAGFTAAPRVKASVLVAQGEISAGAEARGVDPEGEATVTKLSHHLAAGHWLDAARPREVVLGKSLARRLNARPGGELVLLGQAFDGSLASEVFQVAGVLKAVNKDLDDRGVFLGLSAFREALRMPDGLHELAVGKASGELTAADLARVKAVAAAVEAVEVKTWRELKPLLARMIALLSVTVYFTMAFTYLALGGLILNTMFMTVYDRMHEYGIMKAVGMLPNELLRLILTEAVALAGLAAVVALALGLPVAWHLATAGLDLSAKVGSGSFAGVNLEPVIFAEPGTLQIAVPLLALLLLTPLFAWYPAREAARLSAKEALERR